MSTLRCLLVALVLAGTGSAAHGQLLKEFSIHPPAPRPFELVTLYTYTFAGIEVDPRVSQEGSDIVVRISARGTPVPGNLSWVGFDIRLGAFPAGTYTVSTVDGGMVDQPGNPVLAPQRLEFTVAAPAPADPPTTFRPRNDYSGHWWNPKESGWGLSIHQSPSDPMMVVFYTYNAAGRPVWYVAPGGRWVDETTWVGPLYRTKGPPMSGNFDPSRVERVVVGTARLSWYGVETGDFPNSEPVLHFRYVIDGIEQFKLVQKLPF
jgi:hypothetical protein